MSHTVIGIATADGVTVCDHLARCRAVKVFEIESGSVIRTAVRAREMGACGNHGSFLDLLGGCRAVICGGIGEGAVKALEAQGIRSVVLAGAASIEDALAGYLAGTLLTTERRVCLCG